MKEMKKSRQLSARIQPVGSADAYGAGGAQPFWDVMTLGLAHSAVTNRGLKDCLTTFVCGKRGSWAIIILSISYRHGLAVVG
jgi:hypothetical protein